VKPLVEVQINEVEDMHENKYSSKKLYCIFEKELLRMFSKEGIPIHNSGARSKSSSDYKGQT
jgi:hypothetical protein